MDACGADNPLARRRTGDTYNRSTLDADTRARWESAIEAFFKTRTRSEIDDRGPAARHQCHGGRDAGRRARGSAPRGARLLARHADGPRTWQVPADAAGAATVLPPRYPRHRHGARTAQPACGCWISPGRWSVRSPPRRSATSAPTSSSSSRARARASRGWTCRSSPRAPGTWTTSRGSRTSIPRSRACRWTSSSRPAANCCEPLIDWADVVVENFSPGTLEKLGLDYPRLTARNPGLIMVSGSVYGQTGPLARELGRGRHRRRAQWPHLPHRLARPRSGDPERRALR